MPDVPETVDEAIEQTLLQGPAGGASRDHRELLLWKFIEILTVYEGPVTIYPDKRIVQQLENP